MMQGRGRGISNTPAWMTNQSDQQQQPPPPLSKGQQQQQDGGPISNGVPNINNNGGGGGGGDHPPNYNGGGPDYNNNNEGGRGGGGGGDWRGGNNNNNGRYHDDYGRSRRGDYHPRDGGGGGGGGGGPRGGGGDWRDNNNRGGGDNYHRNRNNNPNERGGRYRDNYHRGGDNRSDRPSSGRYNKNPDRIHFNSLAEERQWAEDRRRRRLERKSLFDVEPTEEQLAMEELQKAALAASGANPASFVRPTCIEATDNKSSSRRDEYGGGHGDNNRTSRGYNRDGRKSSSSSHTSTHSSQQTRHARRLYIGHLPPDLTEEEVHSFFKTSILTALGKSPEEEEEDPILSVYINKERRFAFVEFRRMEVCTSCLALDGIDVCSKGKVKIKRPNDYNPSLAPRPDESYSERYKFDLSRLGIVSSTVADSPNKIFIGGLPYHLTEGQVLELLGAFGSVRAFHLVKADPTALTSKGYCFVEYVDGEVRDVAIMGLNGMDMGGGKVLSARIAAVRGAAPEDGGGRGVGGGSRTASGLSIPGIGNVAPIVPSSGGASGGSGAPAIMRYVDGVDVEALLDVAMGITTLPNVGAAAMTQAVAPVAPAVAPPPVAVPAVLPTASATAAAAPASATPVLDIANAALEAAFGGDNTAVATTTTTAAPAPTSPQTRILVLHNMVMDEDLETDEDYLGLSDEVKEECTKFGKLLSMKIPRKQDGYPETALKKIYLEYASVQDAINAERELAGRQFGPAVVKVTYFDDTDYAAGKIF